MSSAQGSSMGSPLEIHPTQDVQGKITCSIASGPVVLGSMCTQFVLVRTLDAVSDPRVLTPTKLTGDESNGYTIHFGDRSGNWHARLEIIRKAHDHEFTLLVSGPEPIWIQEWYISDLEVDDWIVPALGGRILSSNMPVGQQESYKHPFWWNAQFVIGQKRDSGLVLRSDDESTNLKVLRIKRTLNGFELGYGFEASNPTTNEPLSCSWSLSEFQGDWRVPVQQHKTWLNSVRPHCVTQGQGKPVSWIKDIDFILEIWGANRNADTPFHTFKEMEERISDFAKLHSPSTTLLYLPGYANNGIDSLAPDYSPSTQCGGEAGFAHLVKLAHELGYKVMIHTNVLALTFQHPEFQNLRDVQVVDCFGRKQTWGMDIDGDWLPEPFFAYANPGYAKWGDLMERVLRSLIKKYALDAVFLDQTLLAFNTPGQPDFLKGMATHVQRLRESFPGVLFGGEGIHDHIAQELILAQIHGIDGIPGIHGSDSAEEWCKAHPVLVETFRPESMIVPHLLTRHPSHPDFMRQDEIYDFLNIMPMLALYDRSQAIYEPGVKRLLDRSKLFEGGDLDENS
ncbi:MAG: DUF6259 domain-containing protein [Candidatus Marinimicrobia bacterium]|nr:DUF6259 domain-containing protein [Candidatus Neomarinimicrobiota bacterium]